MSEETTPAANDEAEALAAEAAASENTEAPEAEAESAEDESPIKAGGTD